MDKIYYKTLNEAREANEIDAWKKSRDLNIDCAKAIDSAVYVHNYATYRYNNTAAAADVISQFGYERVYAVVAANIRDTSWDGRWSFENKEWAEEIPPLPHETLYLSAHKIVLDSFANEIRKPALLEDARGVYAEELSQTDIKCITVSPDCKGVAYAEHKNARNMPYDASCAYPFSTWQVVAQLPHDLYNGESFYLLGRYFESEEKAREDYVARLDELNIKNETGGFYYYEKNN
jgi:hypothetical protein